MKWTKKNRGGLEDWLTQVGATRREQRFPVVASAEKRGRRARGKGGPGLGPGI